MDLVINNKLIDSPITTILETLKEETNRGLFAQIHNKGDNVMTNCPCHKNGLEKKPSCSIYNSTSGSTQYGWVHCFACGYNVPLFKMVGDVFSEDENYKALYEQLRDYGHPRPKTPAYPQLSTSFQQSLENIALSGSDTKTELDKSTERINAKLERYLK